MTTIHTPTAPLPPLLPLPAVAHAPSTPGKGTGTIPPRTPRTPLTPITQRVNELVPDTITPDRKYPISLNKKGKLTVQLTPGAKEARDVIYMFRKKSTGEALIGYTEQTVGKRMQGYNSAFRSETSQKGQMPLPQAVREAPDDFEFGILVRSDGTIPIGRLEERCIELKNSIENGYNQRSGGGGAHSQNPIDPEKADEIVKNLFAEFSSPKKTPLKKEGKRVVAPLSPASKKAKGVVYVYYNTVTKQRYVGKTIRTLMKRTSEHLHYAAHPEKDAGKAPLYEAIRKDAENIHLGILYKAEQGDEDYLCAVEKAFIERYNSYENGYNQNAGTAAPEQ